MIKIKKLLNAANFFYTPPIQTVDKWAIEGHEEQNLRLNHNISLLSVYQGSIGPDQNCHQLSAEPSEAILPGDMELLIICYAGGIHKNLPKGFHCILECENEKGGIGMLIGYRIVQAGDKKSTVLSRETAVLFVSLLTLRGADLVVDSAALLNKDNGERGTTHTPRVKTAEDGAVVSIFLWDDPVKANLQGHKLLTTMENDGKGFAVGIGKALGGISHRVKAISDDPVSNGHDISAVVSLF